MTVYSYAQLEGLWINAGGPKAVAPIMAAIAEAESGGNSDSYNPRDTNGWPSAGLWQINDGGPAVAGWADPATNAKYAVGKYNASLKAKGNGFLPWGTYTSGAYKGYLSGKTTPDANVPGSPTGVSAQVSAGAGADCLVGNPFSATIGLGPLSVGTSAGPSCLFTKSNARAFIGAGLIALSVPIAMAAIAVAAVAAGQAIGVVPGSAQVVRAARRVPGAQATASTATSAGTATESAVKPSAKPEDDDAVLERLLGQPKENPDLEVRGGAVRETDQQRAARRRREAGAARARARRSVSSGQRPASREEAGF